jgi:adenine phosphoribosyltransferase
MTGDPVDLTAAVRAIPDHPTPGVLFFDLMPLFADARALDEAVARMADWARPRGVDLVLGAESRGFILGGALARELGVGFVAARKPGKLPFETVRQDYTLEYGEDGLEMHVDAIRPGQRVLIHDDLLATGGTAAAKARLVELLGGVVAGFVFVVELTFLPGRERLAPGEVHSLVTFGSDRVAT